MAGEDPAEPPEAATMGDMEAEFEEDAVPGDMDVMGDVRAPVWKSNPPLARII